MTDQFELASTFCLQPRQFAWFLGAGASAAAGLPTAWDVIWDLKRRHYCRAENQEISRQDVQVDAVRARIQSYMISKGFPKEGESGEYTTYFEKIFGEDRERQRQYLSAILSEDKVTLSVGSRVLGALIATGRTRTIFTTNFDTVVERAVAEVSGRSLSAYHLEGASSANNAINNDEFPFYCKLHGDFRYDSIKNLGSDLSSQNDDLSKALLNAANRFGFIIAGYSGRDESVMNLFYSALKTHNPFPHGLFWTGMKGAPILPSVAKLIEDAQQTGITAAFVEVETFDAFMSRLWRNMPDKEPAIDIKVKRSQRGKATIPLPAKGKGSIIRLNALPIANLPDKCHALSFSTEKEWRDLRAATAATNGQLIFTKAETVFCWGQECILRRQFKDIQTIKSFDFSDRIANINNHLYVKGFLEEALCRALARDKPLLSRSTKSGSYIIANSQSDDLSALQNLHEAVGKPFGQIAGMLTPIDGEHPHPEKVYWAEAIRISIEFVNGKRWLLIDPDLWIWPQRARREAIGFLNQRRSDRYNDVYNSLLEAWLAALFVETEIKSGATTFSPFDLGTNIENPSFGIGRRTAYSQSIAL